MLNKGGWMINEQDYEWEIVNEFSKEYTEEELTEIVCRKIANIISTCEN